MDYKFVYHPPNDASNYEIQIEFQNQVKHIVDHVVEFCFRPFHDEVVYTHDMDIFNSFLYSSILIKNGNG